jgi:hypothetical protein
MSMTTVQAVLFGMMLSWTPSVLLLAVWIQMRLQRSNEIGATLLYSTVLFGE